jgi:Tfp pilus assembly protein PilF
MGVRASNLVLKKHTRINVDAHKTRHYTMSQKRIDLISEMLNKNPEDSYLRYAIAIEYLNIGDRNRAIKELTIITKNDKSYMASYYQLGTLLEQKGAKKKAIDVYKSGYEVAKKKNDIKTMGELSEALLILNVYDDQPY